MNVLVIQEKIFFEKLVNIATHMPEFYKNSYDVKMKIVRFYSYYSRELLRRILGLSLQVRQSHTKLPDFFSKFITRFYNVL